AGVEPIVYATRRLGSSEVEGLEPANVRPIFRPLGSPPRIDLWGDLVRLVAALLRDPPDAVHLCHAGLAPWVRPLRAALPCAVTCHAHGNDLLAPWVWHGGGARAYERALQRGLAAADATFAVSRFTLSLLEARGLGPGRARLLYGGVDAGRFRPGPPDPELGARYGLAPGDEVLLTVSRLAPRKGHRVALAALARLAPARPRLVYAFTGEGPRLLDGLRAEARALGVEGRLRPLGAVPEADLPGLYRLARAFVLLSEGAGDDVEGFGIALLEAAASGLPAVVARSGGMVEAVDEGRTGLVVPPGDAAAAAEALGALLGDGAAARAMGAAARARAEASFSWGGAARGLVDAWTEALAGPRRARRTTGLAAAIG
ncbi:MAG TPA: glycosyltransferase family 4 protein, partial [Polyangiaceae bacterium]|nr:glycosyltransferase family 4 protein [Polyangiaceae bacterium]